MQSILGNTRKADIIFRKTGQIDIMARVAKYLDMKQGDVIDIMQDKGECYLYVKFREVAGRHKAMVFKSNTKGMHFRTNAKDLCDAMMNICCTSKDLKLCIGNPVSTTAYGVMLPIITKLIL